jgi:uncharacterized protein YjdB
MPQSPVRFLSLLCLATLPFGCRELDVTAVDVTKVEVSPKTPTLVVGQSVRLAVRLEDATGNTLDRPVTWSSTNTSVATVAADGTVSAIGPGASTIRASAEGQTDVATVEVLPRAVASVTISPPSAELAVKGTLQLNATVADADGLVLTDRTVSWVSGGTGVATVDGSGLITAVAVGTATITALSEGRCAQATITVTPQPVATVEIAPTSASVIAGDSVQLQATTRAADGGVLTGRPVTWSTSDNTVATVASTGLVKAIAPGTASITATSEGQGATATVTVTPKPVASVSVTPPSATLQIGGSLQLTATTLAGDGSTLTGRTVAWDTNSPGAATVGPSGIVTAFALGTATVTATSEGMTGQATITVVQQPVDSVVVTPASAALAPGDTMRLSASLLDASGGTLQGTVTWSTSDGAIATVDTNGLVKAVGQGASRITASAGAKSGSASITVGPVPVASVTVAPATATAFEGDTVRFVATLKAADGTVLTGRTVSWSTSNGNVATVDGTGLATAQHVAGTATITATAGGQSGSATLQVDVQPVASVTVKPSSVNMKPGDTVQLTAELRAADGTILTGRTVTWDTSAVLIALVNQNGAVLALLKGNATISATAEGNTGTAKIQVR